MEKQKQKTKQKSHSHFVVDPSSVSTPEVAASTELTTITSALFSLLHISS
jgi:hypothetical protein